MTRNLKNRVHPFFLAVVTLAITVVVGFGTVVAYTQTAFPTATDNELVLRMDGPWGDGGIVIGATTTWSTKTDGDKTLANFNKKSRTITLTEKRDYNNNPYNARLVTTKTTTTGNDNGNYQIITFDVTYTIPAHYKYTGFEIVTSGPGTARYRVTNTNLLTHGTQRDVTVRYEVNLYYMGIISGTVRYTGTPSIIHLGADIYNIDFFSTDPGGNVAKNKTWTNQAACGAEVEAPTPDDVDYYKFEGWYTGINGTGTFAANGGDAVSTCGTDKKLYALWRNILHTVSFDGNGATSGSMDNVSGEEGDSIELPSCGFKRKGYYFCGWAESKDGATLYRDGDDFQVNVNAGGKTTKLYAVWSRDGSFQVDNVIEDTSMFEGCDNLVGGNGTKYDYGHRDSKEANIDTSSDRGYFTAK